nr:MAG: replication initiator protein [Microvirus sp.]
MAQCIDPFFVVNPSPSYGKEKIPVPCGKCPICLKRRASAWAFRLKQAYKLYPIAHFLTLTYAEAPISNNNFMTLVKRDFQNFIKRLRKAHPKGSKISYYAVGEYGGQTWRPHYHAIIFNVDSELIEKCWNKNSIPFDVFDPHVKISGIAGIWQADPDVNDANIAYVCKYLHKGRRIPIHKNDDRVPEFSLMSKNFGLNYLTPEIIRYHLADPDRMYVTLEDGVKLAMPRYYRDRIYSEEQRLAHSIKVSILAETELILRKAEFGRKYPNQHFERSYHETVKALNRAFFEKAIADRNKL